MLASAFYLGLSPWAPGSFGALAGVAVHVAVVILAPPLFRTPLLLAAFALILWIHVVLTPWAVAFWRSEDPKNFVLDEVLGYLVVPILFHSDRLFMVVIPGFLLFRVFDVIKLPLARQIDRDMHGPWGIVLDDIVSAGYAVLCLYGLRALTVFFGLKVF